MPHSPHSAEINYLAESMHDEEIVIKTSSEETVNIVFNHSAFRISDGREVCRIRLEWSEKTRKREA